MLTITKRPAKLGSSINTRTQRHGEEPVPACDIPIVGIMLEAEEVNAFLGDPKAHETFFTEERGFIQPRFQQLRALTVKDKFEGAAVRLTLGMNGAGTGVQLEQATLASVTLEPLSGGLTELSLTVQATPTGPQIGDLVMHLSREVSVEILDAKRAEKSTKQGELPINTPADKAKPKRRSKNADAETLQ